MDVSKLTGDSLVKFLKYKLGKWDGSDELKTAKEGHEYYRGKQAIDNKKRLGRNHEDRMVELRGLPNVIAKDNQYAKLVDQKINYLLSHTPLVSCKESEDYTAALTAFLDRRFMRTWNKIGKDAMNCRIGWMYLYTDGKALKYKKVDAKEIIPIWRDAEHESLDALIRRRGASRWDEEKGEIVVDTFVEFYTDKGVQIFKVTEGDRYELVTEQAYMTDAEGLGWNWGKIPFIYWRYSPEEMTLLERVKTLQDIINLILSTFGDNMMEDSRNSILVIKGYDGENKYDIRAEMNQSGVLQVAEDGSVDTLTIEVNAENYETYLRILKEKLIENGRGLDAKQERTGNAPNELNIKSMYSDIELDANGMELEFQASFEHFQWFFKKVYKYPENLLAEIEFKRRMMVNEESVIKMIRDSAGIVSEKTLRERHPFVDDADEEEKRISEEGRMDDPYAAVQEVIKAGEAGA